ncbi:cytochrome c [Flavobacterium zhairuonense]|uniref:c-type cytochrome n=1 Tax=Flavobacterium zhairuonense TaxID=2493631 RepID=UPI0010448911|nr:cytochrome c [Flavobacterium zhairuonense]KAF2515379.1 cytochrome c [Flavobacterium zhairuonense]
MKKNRFLFLFFITLIILIGGITFYKTIIKSEDRECGFKSPKQFNQKPLTLNQRKGREVFNSNCAACHKLNSKSTGPALSEVDSIVFVNWLTNKKHKIDSSKVEILAIDYHKTMFSKTLNSDEVGFLIDYIKH